MTLISSCLSCRTGVIELSSPVSRSITAFLFRKENTVLDGRVIELGAGIAILGKSKAVTASTLCDVAQRAEKFSFFINPM